jgi:hypothetical protein
MDEQTQPTSEPQIGQQGEQPRDPQSGQPGIDVERLAERVYQLFLAEARLAHARGERTGQRRKH